MESNAKYGDIDKMLTSSVEVPDTDDEELKSIMTQTYEIMTEQGIYEKTWNPEKNKHVYILTDLGIKLQNQNP